MGRKLKGSLAKEMEVDCAHYTKSNEKSVQDGPPGVKGA
jgi:hypothetical protein